jgi:PilZ domain
MEQNRRRVPRFRFFASAELLDEASGAKNRARLTELSLYGCYIETANPSPVGTTFSAKIFTDTEYFESRATVVYAHPNSGMGMTFSDVKPHFLPILKGWLLSALQDARREEQST